MNPPTVEYVTDAQLIAERADILARLEMTDHEARQRAASWQLTLEQRALFDALEEVNFLLSG